MPKQKRNLFSKTDGTSFWEDVKFFFQSAFTKIDEWLDDVGWDVIQFMEGLNAVLKEGTWSGDVLDYLTELIPGDVDDAALAFLREHLEDAIYRLTGFVTDGAEESILNLLDEINTDEGRRMYVRALAADLAGRVSQDQGHDKLTPSEVDTLTQAAFQRIKERGYLYE